MIVPLLLMLTSVVACLAWALLPGPSDFLLLGAPCALASLLLLLRAARKPRVAPAKARLILIDGSNVMHWKDNTPNLASLCEVTGLLADRGYTPLVVFDANAGYLISGKYQHDEALAALLGLPAAQVMVVPKGTPADPALLGAARKLGARIVTNDRYRDWADAHPEVRDAGHLIKGGFHDTGLWLDLNDSADMGGRDLRPARPV